MKKYPFVLYFLLLPSIVFADPSKSEVIKQKNSRCSVKISAGEYPSYTVMRGKKAIFSPKSDGIVKALISPSGRYVALSAGEVDLIDVQKGKMEFGVAVVNCKSGKVAGYFKGKPTSISRWNADAELESDSGNLKFGENGLQNLPQ